MTLSSAHSSLIRLISSEAGLPPELLVLSVVPRLYILRLHLTLLTLTPYTFFNPTNLPTSFLSLAIMQTTFALVAALAATAFAAPQATDQSGAVTSPVSPSGPAPTGAQTTYPGAFQLTVVNITVTGSAKAKVNSNLQCRLIYES